MKFSTKLALLAIAAAPITTSAPAFADDSCGAIDQSLMLHTSNVLPQISEIMLLESIQASDICLVPVNEALNGDIGDALALKQVSALNNLQIGALQSVLSDVIVIASGGDLIDIEDFLNDNDIDLEDILAADVASGNLIILYMPQSL